MNLYKIRTKLKKRITVIFFLLLFLSFVLGVFAFILLFWMDKFGEKLWLSLIYVLIFLSVIVIPSLFVIILFMIKTKIVEKKGNEEHLEVNQNALFSLFLTRNELNKLQINFKTKIHRLDFCFYINSMLYIDKLEKISFIKEIFFNLINSLGLIVFCIISIGIFFVYLISLFLNIVSNEIKKIISKEHSMSD